MVGEGRPSTSFLAAISKVPGPDPGIGPGHLSRRQRGRRWLGALPDVIRDPGVAPLSYTSKVVQRNNNIVLPVLRRTDGRHKFTDNGTDRVSVA
jgi:hypothetical protein